MNRLSLLTTSLLTAVATSSPTVPPGPVPTELPVPIVVDYTVTTSSAGPGTASEPPMLAGQMVLQPDRSSYFQRKRARSDQEIQFAVEAHPNGEQVLVSLHWEERTPEGDRINWTPNVGLKHGEKVTTHVNWPGGGRTVVLSLR